MATFVGTGDGDRIDGANLADRIFGEGSGDGLYGWGGADRLSGGPGEDWVEGDGGNDVVLGGSGNDYLFGDYSQIQDDPGSATAPEGNDTIRGGTGDDYLDGGSGADRLYGDAGNDVLFAYGSGSRLSGGAGNDDVGGIGYLSGGAGNDWVHAQNTEAGDSTRLNAGTGNDAFGVVMNGTTDPTAHLSTITIEDFHHGQDQIRVFGGVGGQTNYESAGPDLFAAFDSNHSGTLGDGDVSVSKDAQGIVAHWWAVDLVIHGDATTAADWLS